MELMTIIIVSVIVLISGWIPPIIVFVLSYRLSNRVLDKADRIRAGAVSSAENVERRIQREVDGMKRENVMMLKGEMLSINAKIDKMEEYVSDNFHDLRVDIVEKDFELPQKQIDLIIDDLGDKLQASVRGMKGADVKALTKELKEDPEIIGMVEEYKGNPSVQNGNYLEEVVTKGVGNFIEKIMM